MPTKLCLLENSLNDSEWDLALKFQVPPSRLPHVKRIHSTIRHHRRGVQAKYLFRFLERFLFRQDFPATYALRQVKVRAKPGTKRSSLRTLHRSFDCAFTRSLKSGLLWYFVCFAPKADEHILLPKSDEPATLKRSVPISAFSVSDFWLSRADGEWNSILSCELSLTGKTRLTDCLVALSQPRPETASSEEY